MTAESLQKVFSENSKVMIFSNFKTENDSSQMFQMSVIIDFWVIGKLVWVYSNFKIFKILDGCWKTSACISFERNRDRNNSIFFLNTIGMVTKCSTCTSTRHKNQVSKCIMKIEKFTILRKIPWKIKLIPIILVFFDRNDIAYREFVAGKKTVTGAFGAPVGLTLFLPLLNGDQICALNHSLWPGNLTWPIRVFPYLHPKLL